MAITKDPSAMLDYGVDWTPFLGDDTISTSTWTVPTGITSSNESQTSTTTTIWLSGGTAGAVYALINRITTAAGRTDERTLRVKIEDK